MSSVYDQICLDFLFICNMHQKQQMFEGFFLQIRVMIL